MGRRHRTLAMILVFALSTSESEWLTAQQQVDVLLFDATGRRRAKLTPESLPPKNPSQIRGRVFAFTRRGDIRAADGKVVTAIGLHAWYDGGKIIVAVVALVPSEGRPNVYSPDTVGELAHRLLSTMILKKGESKVIREAVDMGIGPMTVSVRGKPDRD